MHIMMSLLRYGQSCIYKVHSSSQWLVNGMRLHATGRRERILCIRVGDCEFSYAIYTFVVCSFAFLFACGRDADSFCCLHGVRGIDTRHCLTKKVHFQNARAHVFSTIDFFPYEYACMKQMRQRRVHIVTCGGGRSCLASTHYSWRCFMSCEILRIRSFSIR